MNLINESINGINVISEYLKIAIIIVIQAIANAGIAAISGQTFIAKDVNNEYAIHHQIIIIANCLKLNHNTIGSSFSI
ncbi:hypothetical protein ACFLY2_02555 [Patescibacteria group bacterium]